ncbi:MAG: hypothetical protein JXB18_00345 [Sedimentisphaerales bacterium]|nr:hypothetical protein [Sedimentisphaerales bacterium]
MENQPKIEMRTPMEHVEQLASIGQQAQDKRKPQERPSGRARKPDIDQILEQEQDLRQSQDEGHIDYHA